MKKNYHMKKTISMKRFIAELGKDFSEHTKKKLLELEVRCVLSRKEDNFRLDLKHVEHTQYDCECDSGGTQTTCQKEFAFGQFIVLEGMLFYSERCTESDKVMQAPIVSTIFNSLDSEEITLNDGCYAKKVDDNNIDYVIDTILTVCPQVSQSYLSIMSKYL